MYNKFRCHSKVGSIAQLGEHLPYKQRVTGSSPVVPTIIILYGYKPGPVVQLVRTLACHARGRRFEPVLGRHFNTFAEQFSACAAMAQAAEHFLGKEEVTSSNLVSSSSYFAWIRVNALFMRILFFLSSMSIVGVKK